MLFKNSLIYLGSSILNRAIPFLMLPILTKYLTPTEFGIWAVFQVFISFFMPIIGMNSQSNITRSFHKRKKEILVKIIFSLILLLTVTSFFSSLLIFLIFLIFDNLFNIEYKYFMLLPILVFVQMINLFNLTIYRNVNKVYSYGIFEIGISFVNILTATVMIVFFNFSWDGMVYSILFAHLLFSFFSLLSMRNNGYLKFDFNKTILKKIFLVSLPLIPHALADVLIQLSDRLFIQSILSSADVGIYTVATYFASILYIITTSFNKSWTPYMMKSLSSNLESEKIKVVKYTYLYFPVMFVIYIILIVFSYFALPIIVDPQYKDAFYLIPWIAIGFLIRGSYSMIFPYFIYKGNTKILAKIAFLGAFINIILNYFLINIYGLIGAAIATIISFCFMTAVSWWKANRIYPMPWFYFLKDKKNE